MISPRLPNASPIRNITGTTHNASGDWTRPSAVATTSTALPAITLFVAAQIVSAMTMSSSVTGAFRIASHVFCTCMRENPEYIASNDALIIVLEQTVPAARNAIYDVPKTSGSMRPSP